MRGTPCCVRQCEPPCSGFSSYACIQNVWSTQDTRSPTARSNPSESKEQRLERVKIHHSHGGRQGASFHWRLNCLFKWLNSLRPSDAYASSTQAIICSDNGLSPVRRQAIIWTNDVSLSPRNKLQSNCFRNSNIFIQENKFENVVWEMSAIFSASMC